MEFANNPPDVSSFSQSENSLVRTATRQDAAAIFELLERAAFLHQHVDWYLPGDWLGTAGFMVAIDQDDGRIRACLSAAADPLPAAWVRLAALEYSEEPEAMLAPLLDAASLALANLGVTQLAWMSTERWADPFLPALGFEIINHIESYAKPDLTVPQIPNAAVQIRPALPEEMTALENLEAETLNPIWRYSARALNRAWRQSVSFDVVTVEGEIVGFQHSTATQDRGGHLARMTIHPSAHGRGIGSTLLAHTLEGYGRAGLRHASLNTQGDNLASQRLYQKFGYRPTGYKLPIWSKNL